MAPGRERMQTTSGFASAIDGPMLNVASLCCRRIELTQLVLSAACGRRRFIGWDPRRFATTANKHRRSAVNAGVSLYRILMLLFLQELQEVHTSIWSTRAITYTRRPQRQRLSGKGHHSLLQSSAIEIWPSWQCRSERSFYPSSNIMVIAWEQKHLTSPSLHTRLPLCLIKIIWQIE